MIILECDAEDQRRTVLGLDAEAVDLLVCDKVHVLDRELEVVLSSTYLEVLVRMLIPGEVAASEATIRSCPVACAALKIKSYVTKSCSSHALMNSTSILGDVPR